MSLDIAIANELNDLNKYIGDTGNSALPNSGYTEVSKKLDNFEFLEDANATYQVVDKNRFVKFGNRIVDTYGNELFSLDGVAAEAGVDITSTGLDFTDSVAGGKAYKSGMGLVADKTYKVVLNKGAVGAVRVYLGSFANDEAYYDTSEQGLISFVLTVKAISAANGVPADSIIIINSDGSFASTVDNISVKEVQVADFTNTAPNVTVVTTNTGVDASKGDYFIDDVNKVKNGGFDLGMSDWATVGVGTIWNASGYVDIDATIDGNGGINQEYGASIGDYITCDLNITAGQVKVFLAGGGSTKTYGVGVHKASLRVEALGSGVLWISRVGSDAIFTVDNISEKSKVSIKQATRNTVDMYDYNLGLNKGYTVQYEEVVFANGTDFPNLSNGEGFYQNIKGSPITFTATTALTVWSPSWKYLGSANAMSLDNPFFRDREDIGVTHQALAYHVFNTTTKLYEGIKTEILFNDMSVFATSEIVMTSNEFTKVSSFLYSKGEYLCLPVMRTQMRNKGAYHPVYNPKGCAGFYTVGHPTSSWDKNPNYNNIAIGFTPYVYNVSDGANLISGKIGDILHRPDGKFRDVIYANDTIDMREFAKLATQFDIDLLRQDKIDNSVKNEVSILGMGNTKNWDEFLSGKFRLNFSNKELLNKGFNDFNAYTGGTTGGRFVSNPNSSQIVGYVKTSSNLYYITEIYTEESNADRIYIEANSGATLSELNSGYDLVLYKTNPIITSYSTDLVGDPANYPTMITDRLDAGLSINGIYPNLVDDTGHSNIPNGYGFTKMSDKVLGLSGGGIYSDNKGVDYNTSPRTLNSVNNTIANIGTFNRLWFISYESANDPYEVTDSLPVIDVEPKVIASNSHSIYKGGKVASQIAGKITTGNGSRGLESKILENAELGRTKYDYVSSHGIVIGNLEAGTIVYVDEVKTGGIAGEFYVRNTTLAISSWDTRTQDLNNTANWSRISTTPEHNAIILDKEVSAGAKWFNVLEEDDYGLHAGIYGQELVWDSNKDSSSEAVSRTESDTSTVVAGTLYRITDGRFIGYYKGLKPVNVALSDNRWSFDENSNIVFEGFDKYFTRWDGTGFGDTKQFDNLSNGTGTDQNGKAIRYMHGRIPLNIKT